MILEHFRPNLSMKKDKVDFCQLSKSKEASLAKTIFYKIRVAWLIPQYRSLNLLKEIGPIDQVGADYLWQLVRPLKMFYTLSSNTPMLKEEYILKIITISPHMIIGHKKSNRNR